MQFTAGDLDVDGLVTQTAIDRETKLMGTPFPVTPSFLQQLYLIASLLPEQDTNEQLPRGRYIEVQVGRHIEHKFMFRFNF